MEPGTATLDGHAGALHVERWPRGDARYLAVLCHGYGEHVGRYGHVADTLVDHGATVVGLDHAGHGRSEGTPVLVEDFEDVVADLHRVVEWARTQQPELPVVMVGHSMGGMIAARYAQLHGEELTALVLSGPVLGRWEAAEQLVGLDPIPEVPIDPDTLSRDPAVGEAYAADPLVWHGSFQRATLEALLACLQRIAEEGPLSGLPTLWVHGEDDQLVPIGPSRDGVHALVPDGDLTEGVRPGARHEVFKETDRHEALAEVTAFVDRVLG
jgi:alpha-beta hydrolase superfamily lysophospholipase